jgi:hypothetical protein
LDGDTRKRKPRGMVEVAKSKQDRICRKEQKNKRVKNGRAVMKTEIRNQIRGMN